MPLDRHVRIVLLRLRSVVRGHQLDRELDEELRDHLARQTEANLARGMTPQDARRAALVALGGLQQEREICRDARGWRWLLDLRQDLRYACRQLRRSPGFSTVAVLTLALGIGATTAIFSVVRAVLLEPLPYDRPEQIVRVYERVRGPHGAPVRRSGMNVRELLELRAHSRTLAAVLPYGLSIVTLVREDDGVQMWGAPVFADTFASLGVQPALGRTFTTGERAADDRVLVLSDRAWRQHFGADPGVLGRVVRFAGSSTFVDRLALGVPYTVVGVMPRGFFFPDERADFWTPLTLPEPIGPRDRLPMLARLAGGVPPAAAAADIAHILGAFRGTAAAPHFELARLQDESAAGVRPAMRALMAAVLFVLLIACANVANLLLARGAGRQREMAVRVAIGAARGRLVRQTLTESLLLAFLGGTAGIALAFGGVGLFRALAANLVRFDLGRAVLFPRIDAIAVDGTALAFAAGLSIGTGLLFGLAPSRWHARMNQMNVLRGAPAPASGFARPDARGTQGLLVLAQIALATLLLVAGGLLIRSFVTLLAVDPGYDAEGALTFQVSVPDGVAPDDALSFADALVARLHAVAGVEAAAYARQLPMVMLEDSYPVRTSAAAETSRATADARFVSWDYLAAMGIRVVAGRAFRETDRSAHPRALVINRTLARAAFGDGNPIGRELYAGPASAPWTVIGVAEDVRQFGLDETPQPQLFADVSQWRGDNRFPIGPYYVMRTARDRSAVIADVRAVVRQMDAGAALYNVAPMTRIVSTSMTRPRMYALLTGLFAGIAVFLAAIGIYGVMAYAVAQRTREIGVRMALGAGRAGITGLVLRQSVVVTAAGILLGAGAAAAATRLLQSLLFGVTPLDPATFLAASAGIAAVAACASIVPARRAMRVDPLVALRAE